MNLPKDQIEFLKSHVAFVCVHKGKDYRAIGTAFLLSITEGDHVFEYWVTCKHVVEPYIDQKNLFLRLNKYMGDVVYVPIHGEWAYHPDKTIDLAILYWLPPANTPAYKVKSIDTISMGLYPGMEPMYKDRAKEGNDVMLLGLFPKYFGFKRNLPIFRFGKVSLLTTEKTRGVYGDTDHYFIECDIWQGNSGAPVYISIPLGIPRKAANAVADADIDVPDELVVLYGIASSFYPHEARGRQKLKKVGREEIKINEVVTHYGISLVTPSEKIVDILYGDDMKKKREKKIDQKREKDKPEPASVDSGDLDKKGGLTKEEFEEALRKIARPLKKDDQAKKGT